MNWFSARKELFKTRRAKIVLGLAVVAFLLMFVPVDTRIQVPAVMHSGDSVPLHAPIPAQIDKINVVSGQMVKEGDVLFELSSHQLVRQLKQAELDLAKNRIIKARQSVAPDDTLQDISIDELIEESETRLVGLREQQEKLVLRALSEGVIKDIAAQIHEGRWVHGDVLLGRLIRQSSIALTGFVPDDNIHRLSVGNKGTFLPDSSLTDRISVRLAEISQNDTKKLPYPELSSLYGGSLPSNADAEQGVESLYPLYTLRFDVIDEESIGTARTQKGFVFLHVQPTSFAGRIVKRVLSLFVREF